MTTITHNNTDYRTTAHRLIDAKLGADGALARAVAEARKADQPISWDDIALWVAAETSDATVTGETLRNWFKPDH